MSTAYDEFLASKTRMAQPVGFDVDASEISSVLFDWQSAIVRWALRQGRAALFEECGLGKTFQQLDWSRLVCRDSGGDTLILAPLAVNRQTVTEGLKLGIEVTQCRSQADVRPGVNIANYEMLSHFNPEHFAGVVLDESSILKSFQGKTKQSLVDSFRNTPYRLCCTATPAPNDYMEIGNHAEFLGIMKSNEMLARWFINDTMNFGSYRLKGHAEADFWDWVASWAIGIRRPSDIGFSDTGYQLPPLDMRQVAVEVDEVEGAAAGELIRVTNMSATTIHKEMRFTCSERSLRAAEIVNNSDETFIVWCNSDYEADELIKLIPDAVEVRGSNAKAVKEKRIDQFQNGEARVIITKPTVCGFGLNWQFCHNAVFVGLSYSFEQFYHAVRRTYRFGQAEPVNVYIIAAATEGAILATVKQKMEAHSVMMDRMSSSTRQLLGDQSRKLVTEAGAELMQVPAWLLAA